MSREATEEGKRGVQAVEALVDEFWEPDGDYYPIRGFPEARPCHGRDEIVSFFAAFFPAWDDYRYAIKDARAIGDDRVLVHGEIRAQGRGERRGAGRRRVPLLLAPAWTIHPGRGSLTAKGALHALGLSGETLKAAVLGA
jgi:SnoaL-like domain